MGLRGKVCGACGARSEVGEGAAGLEKGSGGSEGSWCSGPPIGIVEGGTRYLWGGKAEGREATSPGGPC